MKPLRIRQWMFVGMAIVLIIPRLVFELAQIIVPHPSHAFASASYVAAAIGAIVFIGWKMGRVVVKPLEAMGAAAIKVADGDLNFELPHSTVAEIVQVRAAFQAMGDGLRESLVRQSKMEEERRFFIHAIAHDLRTPLFTLRGFLSRLKRGYADDPEKASRYVAICGQKAEQLDRLVTDLFSYTRLEYLEQTLRPEQIEFNSFLSETLNDYRPYAKEKEIELRYDSDTDHVLVLADSHLLRRAMGNLIDNALRYTPSTGRIEVSWKLDSGKITFTIEDSGPGIAEQDLPHIFEPLYRGDDSRNPGTGGTGLGLAIARRIMRAHGGDLSATNRTPSGGAVFTGWIAR
ncbi:sensor histidine kinase [Cohnella cholangitidis]|uniref:histidine kinase n=1 Tax=Cohnella cholangitidis TaxID=2598458 RepID=A0A7G5C347_9BACL|nr:HAMP domain-containing sensor histidine kinase [Cohnella cholangitidis]QMV43631.1 HAMP domain-containing histidine kinase [Cohnella cholangitidis]